MSARVRVATRVPIHTGAKIDLDIHPNPDVVSSNEHQMTIFKDQVHGPSEGGMGATYGPSFLVPWLNTWVRAISPYPGDSPSPAE